MSKESKGLLIDITKCIGCNQCAAACKAGHKQPGDPCTRDAECSFDYVCAAGKCAAPPRVGEGNACGAMTPPCADGLFCDETGRCASLRPAGAPCAVPGACKDGLGCSDGACTPFSDAGKPCGGAAGLCPATQSCTGGSCAPLPGLLAGAGTTCTGDTDCQAALFCDHGYCRYRVGLAGTCDAERPCGAACVSGSCAPASCASP